MQLIFGLNFSGGNRTQDSGFSYYESKFWKRYKIEHAYTETTETHFRETYNAFLGAHTNHVANPGTWNADNRDRLERAGFNSVGYGSSYAYGVNDGTVPAMASPNGTTDGRPFTIYFSLKGISLPNHPHIEVAGFFGGGKFFPDIYNTGYVTALQSELAFYIGPFLGSPTPSPWQRNFVGFMVDGEKIWCNKAVQVAEGTSTPAPQLMRNRWPLVSAGFKRMWNTGPDRLASKYQLLRAAIDNHPGAYAVRLADFKQYYRGLEASMGQYTVDLTGYTEIQIRNMDIGVGDNLPMPFATWSSVVESDMNAVVQYYANDYYRLIRQNMPANCLFLGDMNLLGHCPDDVADVEADWVDVMSFNNYSSAADTDWAAYNAMEKPVFIGEFSFPGASAGSAAGAHPFPLLECWNGNEQGRRAVEFLTKAAEQPNIIGASWYRYHDEPLGGRISDGENMKLGIIDVTDQMRRGLVTHLNSFSSNLYTIRPFDGLGWPGPPDTERGPARLTPGWRSTKSWCAPSASTLTTLSR